MSFGRFEMEHVIALVALTAMEIVLGIDNIVFIAVITSRLPVRQRPLARRLGLGLAMVFRIALLTTLWAIIRHGDTALFELTDLGVPEAWLEEEANAVTWKDLILLGGGLFLIWKSVHEIHKKFTEYEESREAPATPSLLGVLLQIGLIDIVFSLDSVITAVGMAKSLVVMIAAIILAVGVMLVFAEVVSRFVEENPTLKMLAMSFLILIGVALVAEGVGTGLDKGYIYFAMAFALAVEILNLRMRAKKRRTVESPAA